MFERGVWVGMMLVVMLGAESAGAQKSVEVKTLEPLAAGVTLPVQLGRSLRAGEVKAGEKIVVRTTQRVPVAAGRYMKRGAEVLGEVVTSVEGDGTAAKPSVLTLRFTQLRYRKQTMPVRVKAIAMANFTDVAETFYPTNGGADRGNPSEANWTTRQVGGDVVVRSGWVGDVMDESSRTVGFADYWGVYRMAAGVPRALGVFSASAAGLYGFDDGVSLEPAKGDGEITLMGVGKKLLVRSGDDFLLEVVGGGRGPVSGVLRVSRRG